MPPKPKCAAIPVDPPSDVAGLKGFEVAIIVGRQKRRWFVPLVVGIVPTGLAGIVAALLAAAPDSNFNRMAASVGNYLGWYDLAEAACPTPKPCPEPVACPTCPACPRPSALPAAPSATALDPKTPAAMTAELAGVPLVMRGQYAKTRWQGMQVAWPVMVVAVEPDGSGKTWLFTGVHKDGTSVTGTVAPTEQLRSVKEHDNVTVYGEVQAVEDAGIRLKGLTVLPDTLR